MCHSHFSDEENNPHKIRQGLSLIEKSSGEIYNEQIHNKIWDSNDS